MVGKTVWPILKRKTALCECGKKVLSKAEDKLILGIPPVVGIRPIVVQPQTIGIAFQVEDVRVVVAVGIAWQAICATARLIY